MNELSPKRDATATADDAAGHVGAARPRRRLFFWFRLVLVIGLLAMLSVWGGEWAYTAIVYIHENDARIKTDLVHLSSAVDGRVATLEVTEGQRVGKGDVVAAIDGRAMEYQRAEMQAELRTLAADIVRIEAEIALINERVDSRVQTERAKLAEATASRDLYEHELAFAEADYKRAETLSRSGAMSNTQHDRIRTDYLKARQQLARARAEIAAAEASVKEAQVARSEIAVKQAERGRLQAKRAEIEARIERQGVDIEERSVRSPIDGVVDRTFVLPGEYVTDGQRIAVLHDPDAIWVETNIRETDISRVRVGQTVKLKVDAYPDEVFEGTVARIGNAATSQFALLPRLNESGTFTKVTQRIEVRIAVAQRDGRLKPGMMVEVFIVADRQGLF